MGIIDGIGEIPAIKFLQFGMRDGHQVMDRASEVLEWCAGLGIHRHGVHPLS